SRRRSRHRQGRSTTTATYGSSTRSASSRALPDNADGLARPLLPSSRPTRRTSFGAEVDDKFLAKVGLSAGPHHAVTGASVDPAGGPRTAAAPRSSGATRGPTR